MTAGASSQSIQPTLTEAKVGDFLPQSQQGKASFLRWRESPATLGICLSWLIIYGAMVVVHARMNQTTLSESLIGIDSRTSVYFGDVSVHAFSQGQVWRILTATFIHFNLLHLVLNMLAMYQLGRLIENWYGSAMMLVIYVALGAGGNLLAILIKMLLNSNPLVHSGGGSTVIFGLVGLCAIAGWRTGSHLGYRLYVQMMIFLLLNGVLGFFVSLIDNDAHMGGAVIGALIGFWDRTLIRGVPRILERTLTGLALLAIGASAAFQASSDPPPVVPIPAERQKEWAELQRLEVQLRRGIQDQLQLSQGLALWDQIEATYSDLAKLDRLDRSLESLRLRWISRTRLRNVLGLKPPEDQASEPESADQLLLLDRPRELVRAKLRLQMAQLLLQLPRVVPDQVPELTRPPIVPLALPKLGSDGKPESTVDRETSPTLPPLSAEATDIPNPSTNALTLAWQAIGEPSLIAGRLPVFARASGELKKDWIAKRERAIALIEQVQEELEARDLKVELKARRRPQPKEQR